MPSDRSTWPPKMITLAGTKILFEFDFKFACLIFDKLFQECLTLQVKRINCVHNF
mgnify:CR=1 FL=1